MYKINELEHMAADEFYYFYNEDKGEEGRKIEPTLECFCKY